MKIHGSNQTNFNPYKDHMQKQSQSQKQSQKKDQLEISDEAKKLMKEDAQSNSYRAEYVKGIKEAVDNGSYKVDHEKTADKMVDFWSKDS